MGNRKQPFGYRVVMGEIALHPQESKLVEYIFQQYLAGATYNTLVEELREQSIPYDEGKLWKRALIEEQRQSNAQAVRRIEDAAAAMAQASTHISEWDEALIRQLVDTVKVNSAEKITVFLRGGVQVEQDMI